METAEPRHLPERPPGRSRPRLLPREDASAEELTEAVEDYCLGKAMDDGRRTPLLSRGEALAYLED